MQERLESSPVGRRAISWLAILVVASVVLSNLPGSELKNRLMRAARPVLLVTGLDQNWGVYAPNPPTSTAEVFARMTYSDGATHTWRIPRGNPVLRRPYRDYRWLKFSEYVNPSAHPDLLKGFVEWLARTELRDGRAPMRIVVVRRLRELVPPGEGGEKRPWKEEVVYEWEQGPEEQDRT